MIQTCEHRRLTTPSEPWVLFSLKGSLYLGAVVCYLVFFTSAWALWSAVLTSLLALISVQAFTDQLSKKGIVTVGALVGGLGLIFSGILEEWTLWSSLLGAPHILRLSEILFFASLSFSLTFLLRSWGRSSRSKNR